MHRYTLLCFLSSYLTQTNCVVFPTNQKISDLNDNKEMEEFITYNLYTKNTTKELFTDDVVILAMSGFNKKRRTKFLIHDWLDDVSSEWIQDAAEGNRPLHKAMASQDRWNIILVNWSPLSYTFYSQAMEHIILVSDSVAEFIKFLCKYGGQPMRSFHFIAHGYGLKIAAKAADKLMEEDKFHRKIYRLSILDPLKELNNNYKQFFDYKQLATFVDVIHTSGGGFGNMTSAGHVDFYPHGGKMQPGCATFYCSHIKACEYWRKSFGNPQMFKAYNYKHWDDLLDKKFNRMSPVPMGIAAHKGIPSGNYYLETMAENSRMSKLSEKEDECIFSWKVFTSWDYMIGNPETAANRVASIVMGFKEALLEEAEKKKNNKDWKIVMFRIFVNITVGGLLIASAYAVVEVVRRSMEPEAKDNIWRMNEITIVMTLISTTFPIIFEVLGIFEQYHPRKQLRMQLARIMLLNLLNLYSLIIALFGKITEMEKQSRDFKPNETVINATTCYNACINGNPFQMPLLMSMSLILPTLLNRTNFHMNTASNLTEKYIFNETFLSNQTWNAYDNTSEINNNVLDFDEEIRKFLNQMNGNLTTWEDSRFENSSTESQTFATIEMIFNTTNLYNETYPNISIYENITNTIMEYFDVIPNKNLTEMLFSSTEDFSSFTEDFTEIPESINKFGNVPSTITPINCSLYCKNSSILNLSNNTGLYIETLDYANRTKLRSLCWETMFGQELVKLTVMDLVMTIVSTLAMDFIRGVFVRVMNNCWCWDLEKKFPQYGDFKVAENILHLVNNQGMVWMGMFFSPGIVVLNVFKLYLMVYFRSWIVLTCNVPHKVVFRASRSNNFYYALLLSMLFLCVLPVGYAIVWVHPSFHCGPFSNYDRIFHIFTKTLRSVLPTSFHRILDYIASPGIVIPLLVLLILIIYYLISLTDALREANNDLKIQLRRERTEERRKMFQIVDRRRRGGSSGSGELGNTPLGKWKKLLNTLPSGKSFDEPPKQELDEVILQQKQKEETPKDILSKLIKRALGRPTLEDEDGTDNELHDSLPEDGYSIKEVKPQVPMKNNFKVQDSEFKNTDSKQNPDIEGIETALIMKKDSRVASGIKDIRQDSLTSNWSENIPVITISKTESLENVLNIKSNLKSNDTEDDATKRLILKKQENTCDKITSINDAKEQKEEEIKHEITTINSDTKTESSTDYKEPAL